MTLSDTDQIKDPGAEIVPRLRPGLFAGERRPPRDGRTATTARAAEEVVRRVVSADLLAAIRAEHATSCRFPAR